MAAFCTTQISRSLNSAVNDANIRAIWEPEYKLNSNTLKESTRWIATYSFLTSGIFIIWHASGFLSLFHLRNLVFLSVGTFIAAPTLGMLFYGTAHGIVSVFDQIHGRTGKHQGILPVVALMLAIAFVTVTYEVSSVAFEMMGNHI